MGVQAEVLRALPMVAMAGCLAAPGRRLFRFLVLCWAASRSQGDGSGQLRGPADGGLESAEVLQLQKELKEEKVPGPH